MRRRNGAHFRGDEPEREAAAADDDRPAPGDLLIDAITAALQLAASAAGGLPLETLELVCRGRTLEPGRLQDERVGDEDVTVVVAEAAVAAPGPATVAEAAAAAPAAARETAADAPAPTGTAMPVGGSADDKFNWLRDQLVKHKSEMRKQQSEMSKQQSEMSDLRGDVSHLKKSVHILSKSAIRNAAVQSLALMLGVDELEGQGAPEAREQRIDARAQRIAANPAAAKYLAEKEPGGGAAGADADAVERFSREAAEAFDGRDERVHPRTSTAWLAMVADSAALLTDELRAELPFEAGVVENAEAIQRANPALRPPQS